MARHNHHTDLCVWWRSCRLPPSAAGLPSGTPRLLRNQDAARSLCESSREIAKLQHRLEKLTGAITSPQFASTLGRLLP